MSNFVVWEKGLSIDDPSSTTLLITSYSFRPSQFAPHKKTTPPKECRDELAEFPYAGITQIRFEGLATGWSLSQPGSSEHPDRFVDEV